MFGKLKDKLKGALSIFSKKAEEEADEVVEEVIKKPEEVVPKIPVEEEVKEEKEEIVAEESKEEEKPAEKHLEEKPEEPKEEPQPEAPQEEPAPEPQSEPTEEKKEEKQVEEIPPEEPIEEKKELKEVTDQELEELDQKISELNKGDEVPQKYNVAKQKFEPNVEEIKELPEEKIEGVKITYFVHGTTTDNENDLCTGWNQGELSELGIQQAKELGEKVKNKFAVIFSSDLKRAADSVRLGFPDLKHIGDERLRECNYGKFNGEKESKIDYKKQIKISFPEGEALIDVERRIAKFLNNLYDEYRGKHIAILAHKAPQLALDVLLKGKTWEEAIEEDWRTKKAWQPGWEYELKSKVNVPPEEPPKEKKSFFSLFKKKKEKEIIDEGPKTLDEGEDRPTLFKKLTTKKISAEKFEKLFWDLEVVLLESNVSIEVIDKIKEDLKEELVNKQLPRDVSKKIEETLKKTLSEILTFKKIDLIEKAKEKKPLVIAFFGINGSGKTTSIAKLTHYFQKNNKSVVLAACDTFRAAAIQQLEEHADKLGVKMIKHDYGSDAAAVAFDAVKYAEKNGTDIVLIDTAGRLHSNTNLMAELEKIIRVTNPDLKIFVGESITGNDCIEQAKKFNDLVEMDGAILTKADVDEKGGAPLSIAYTINKPILFLGMGQKYEDLEKFDKNVILERLGF